MAIDIKSMLQIPMEMYGFKFGLVNFYVLEKNSDKYDLIIGLDFMRTMKMKIHPHRNSVEWTNESGSSYEVLLTPDGMNEKGLLKEKTFWLRKIL